MDRRNPWASIAAGARKVRQLLLRMRRAGAVALTLLVIIGIADAVAPRLWPIPFAEANFRASSQGVSAQHPIGTDVLGRDRLSRLIVGTRVSLLISVSSQIISVAAGVVLGLLAGTSRRWSDSLIMRSIDISMAVPDILLLVLLIPLFGSALHISGTPGPLVILNDVTGGALGVTLAITLTTWMLTTRLVRAEVLSLRQSDFYRGAIVIGASRSRLMFVHLLPNVAPVILTAFSLGVPRAILLESAVSYLGLGLIPPTPSIGLLIADGVKVMRSQPSALVFPALLLCILVVSINLVGDSIRSQADRNMEGRA
jgi:peptide/nickel transport system permease protein